MIIHCNVHMWQILIPNFQRLYFNFMIYERIFNPDHTKIYVRLQLWNFWKLCWDIDVGPPLFTLFQPGMPTDSVWIGQCEQCLSAQNVVSTKKEVVTSHFKDCIYIFCQLNQHLDVHEPCTSISIVYLNKQLISVDSFSTKFVSQCSKWNKYNKSLKNFIKSNTKSYAEMWLYIAHK